MPEKRYDGSRQTIGTLLATTSPRLEVPEWQRSFSWRTAEFEAFWADLVHFDETYPGDNIVGEEYFLGSVVLVTGGPTNLLLDGQQRLATATILLSVLREARKTYKDDAATRLQTKYIAEIDDATNATAYNLTLNVYDRNFFKGEIQDVPADPPARPQPTLRSHALIRKARLFFEAQLAKTTEGLDNELAFKRNLRIGRVLCDHMSVIAVTSTDEDNAAAVFETLNDRGIGLSTPDLLRNLLIRRALEGARDRIVAAWQTVLAVNEDGNVDEFLRHYWVSKHGDVKARKLYREIKEKIQKDNIDSLEFSLELESAAPVYRDIAKARENDAELQRSLKGIQSLGARALYPMLLSAYAGIGEGDDKDQLRRLARALITMFVRYNVIGGRESTAMESKVYELAAELRKTQDVDAAVKGLADLAPDGKEFLSKFSRASVSRGATANYLLREIEHAKRKTQEVAVEAPDRVHVEHIYPQTPAAEKWPGHSSLINRIGNLTLLSRRFNTSIKNADFDTKKKAYAESDLLMTKELVAYDEWSLASIDDRQMELSNWVFDIWSFPGEAPPEDMDAKDGTGDGGSAEPDEALDQLPEVPTG